MKKKTLRIAIEAIRHVIKEKTRYVQSYKRFLDSSYKIDEALRIRMMRIAVEDLESELDE